jgi:dethiobiotin synthetase
LSPLGEGFDTRNLILALRAVPLIVAPNRLGGVNQIRLTLGALPTSARRRAIVVLNTPRAGDRAARHNAALVTEWEPATPIIKLPWCPHWQEPAAPLSHTTRQALAAILRAARLDP